MADISKARARALRKDIVRVRKEKRKRTAAGYIDYTLLLLVILLMAFGFVMLYSTSSYYASLKFGDSLYYLKRQAVFAGGGFIAMWILSRFDYRKYRRIALPFMVFSLLLCIAVMFIGHSSHGSARWIRLGPLTIQPSEIAKAAVIIFTAAVIRKMPREANNIKGMAVMAALQITTAAVILKENMSTALIVAGIVFIMLFVASRRNRPFAAIVGAGVLLVILALIFGGGYRMRRVNTWLHPELDASGDGYQTMQALYAIGSGGLFGKGLGESMQKQFIPEVQNDMIFSIICEELGLFGAVCLIVLYLVLLWRLVMIAVHCRDIFGSFLVIGVTAHLGLQVILNIAVVTNMMPNTGVTLPFVSYGGTALLMTMAEIGIVLDVSRNTTPGLDAV